MEPRVTVMIDRRILLGGCALAGVLAAPAMALMSRMTMNSDREILWRRVMDDLSFERAQLHRRTGETLLSGHVMIAEKGLPLLVDYRIAVDAQWRTRSVAVAQQYLGKTQTLRLDHDGQGNWRIDGLPAPALAGCLDVDLGVSPSTNMLPVNRLSLVIGAVGSIRAAWVRFPALDVIAASQSYERLDHNRYHYRSIASGVTAVLDVDADGLPIDYQGIWKRVAEGAPSVEGADNANGEVGGFASALVAAHPSPELGRAADDFGWLVGGWSADVTDFGADGTTVESRGEWWFEWVLEGRAMQDVWISPPRNEREAGGSSGRPNRYGTTIRRFDAAARLWRIVWINPVSGASNALAGRREGNRIVLLGEEGGKAIRWSFIDIAADSFTWVGEERGADGAWRRTADFRLLRIVPAATT